MPIIMTNNNSIARTGLSLAAISLTLTGSVFAGIISPGTAAFNTADADTSGSLTLEEFTATLAEGTTAQKAKRAFKKADGDKSGGVTLPEYLIHVGEAQAPTKEELSFAAADANENGSLDLEEFADTFTGKTAPIEIRKRFLKADADVSGALSLEEWTLHKKGKAKGPDGVKYYKFDLADLNEDNELTIEEFALAFPQGTKESAIAVKFAKKDKNDNGVLTRSEWNPGAPKQSNPSHSSGSTSISILGGF